MAYQSPYRKKEIVYAFDNHFMGSKRNEISIGRVEDKNKSRNEYNTHLVCERVL